MAIYQLIIGLDDASITLNCDDAIMKVTSVAVNNPTPKTITVTCPTKVWTFKIPTGTFNRNLSGPQRADWVWMTDPKTGSQYIGGFEYSARTGV